MRPSTTQGGPIRTGVRSISPLARDRLETEAISDDAVVPVSSGAAIVVDLEGERVSHRSTMYSIRSSLTLSHSICVFVFRCRSNSPLERFRLIEKLIFLRTFDLSKRANLYKEEETVVVVENEQIFVKLPLKKIRKIYYYISK